MSIKPPAWGLSVPPEALRAWGARAIYSYSGYSHARVDVVWDRQEFVVAEGVEREGEASKRFGKWIDDQHLAQWCEEERLMTNEDRLISRSHGSYYIEASPNRSFGYLYIAAWEMPPTRIPEPV